MVLYFGAVVTIFCTLPIMCPYEHALVFHIECHLLLYAHTQMMAELKCHVEVCVCVLNKPQIDLRPLPEVVSVELFNAK